MSENMSGYPWGGRATGIQAVEARDAGKHPAVHRTVPTAGLPSPKGEQYPG